MWETVKQIYLLRANRHISRIQFLEAIHQTNQHDVFNAAIVTKTKIFQSPRYILLDNSKQDFKNYTDLSTTNLRAVT